MTDPSETSGEAEDLRRAYDSAEARIEATEDAALAFDRATALLRAADDIVGAGAKLRGRMAGRLMKQEKFSLAQLADRLGISKSRADQLVRAGTEVKDK